MRLEVTQLSKAEAMSEMNPELDSDSSVTVEHCHLKLWASFLTLEPFGRQVTDIRQRLQPQYPGSMMAANDIEFKKQFLVSLPCLGR